VRNRVVITGIGAISAAGTGVSDSFHALIKGFDGLKPLTLFDSKLKAVPLCAQINSIPYEHSNIPRPLSLALRAVSEALEAIPDRTGLRLGVIAATSVGGITTTERLYEKILSSGNYSAHSEELAVHEPSILASEICVRAGGCGFHTLSTACSTGLHAIGAAKRLIDKGEYDLCLAVGSDALSLLTVRGFASLTLLDPQGCRPFDKRRAGISLGEGAAAMILASEETAAKLNCKPLAVVSGWGASADHYHMTAPHPEGNGACRAIVSALGESKLYAENIDLVITHGTGTPDNDKAEIIALKKVFGRLPPFCSMKRTFGHTLAASGILEAIFGVKCLNEGIVPTTAGFEMTDDEIGVSPSLLAKQPVTHVLKNSFGFGGNNAALILSHAEEF
jgi:3-oxoacyl-[acyl-carrier-protein] synthase-1